MDSQHILRLKEEQEQALIETERQIKQWEKFKSDYGALKTRLKTLPDKVSHDIMVPFGKFAFMPGRLVHTNEILVLLGDNWFVERSAKQAVEIINRRMKGVNEHIQELQKQKNLLTPRLDYTSHLQSSNQEQGVVDITEEYDEEKEKLWKEQHKKSVKKYKDQLKHGNQLEEKRPMTDEEVFARLDELQKQEREGRELQMLTDEVKLASNTLDEDENTDDIDDFDESDEEDSSINDDASDEQSTDSVGEDSEAASRTSRITFSHEKVSQKESSSGEPTPEHVITSPSDIYKVFCVTSDPRSILKSSDTKNRQQTKTKKKVKVKEDITIQESRQKRNIQPVGPVAFSSTVVEKPTPSEFLSSSFDLKNASETDIKCFSAQDSNVVFKDKKATEGAKDVQPRRVSKFKAERQKKT